VATVAGVAKWQTHRTYDGGQNDDAGVGNAFCNRFEAIDDNLNLLRQIKKDVRVNGYGA
jgi:hypothetical protein